MSSNIHVSVWRVWSGWTCRYFWGNPLLQNELYLNETFWMHKKYYFSVKAKVCYCLHKSHAQYNLCKTWEQSSHSFSMAIKLLIIMKQKTYLLRKIHRMLTCHWVAMCSSCHCTGWLNDNHSTLSSCKGVLRLLYEHHLLIGYSLTTIKSQILWFFEIILKTTFMQRSFVLHVLVSVS